MNVSKYIQTEKEVKRCEQCNCFIQEDSLRFKARKFCSRKCNRRFFSLKRYHRIKNSKDYKDYRKGYYRGWVDKNRDKFNNYMREYMREAAPKYKKKKREADKQTIKTKPTIFKKANVFKNTVEVGKGIHDTIPARG